MEFNHPAILVLIPLVLVGLGLLWLKRSKERQPSLRHSHTAAAATLPVTWRARLRHLVPILHVLILCLVILALAGPRRPSDEVPIKKEGVDIVVAFDISTSMKALDFEPTDRFRVAKDTIAQFSEGRTNDRMGLVIFAGEAFTQCPLTLDYGVFRNILNMVRIEAVEQEMIKDGTAIGDALAIAVNRLRNSEAKSKVVILLTDGDNNAGNMSPKDAASMASELGIRIHTVQVGKGGVVPVPVKVRDFFGQVVDRVQQAKMPVNPELLRDIAMTTGGSYFLADDSQSLHRIFNDIDSLEKTELPGEQFTLYEELYAWFAFPAVLLLFLFLFVQALYLKRFP